MCTIDSVLLVGFGGPTRPEHILPFLERVVRGRGVPPERLQEVAHHYHEIGGRSPYNELTFRQAVALKRRLLQGYGLKLPVYAGMRNWDPFLEHVVARMNAAGRRRTAGIILASHRSQTSLERYKLDVQRAIEVNGGAGPSVEYLEPWFDDPQFAEANAARIEEASGYSRSAWPETVPILFTAHSIPLSMANGSPYVEDILVSCRLAAGLLGTGNWSLAYQSRSGDGRVPWLEPDVSDVLRRQAEAGVREVVVQPIGFLHDHVEVLYDLDVEARATAAEVGITLHRAGTVSDHPVFIDMLAQRVVDLARSPERLP